MGYHGCSAIGSGTMQDIQHTRGRPVYADACQQIGRHGVTSDGFAITQLPAASAGAIFQVKRYRADPRREIQGEQFQRLSQGIVHILSRVACDSEATVVWRLQKLKI